MGWFSRKKKAKPAAQGDSFQNNNPYSQETTSSRPDAYDPKPSGGYGGMGGLPPPAYEPGNATLSAGGLRRDNPPQFRDEKSPVPQGGYGRGGGTDSGHFTGAGSYADQQGYGSERYGRDSRTAQPQYQRSGGYGGMGSLNDDNSQDPSRLGPHNKDLYGNAAQRAALQPVPSSYRHVGSSDSRNFQSPPAHGKDALSGNGADRPQQKHSDSTYSSPGNYNGTTPTGHDKTAGGENFDDEDTEVSDQKRQIRETRDQSLQSTRNALRAVESAAANARNAHQNLAVQREILIGSERNINSTRDQAWVADGKISNIKKYNKSMFNASGYITSNRTIKEQELKAEEHTKASYDERVKLREEGYAGAQKLNANVALSDQSSQTPRQQVSKSKSTRHDLYSFENDEEDNEKEDEINANVDALLVGVKSLHQSSKAMHETLDEDVKLVDRIHGKTDDMNVELERQTRRLNRIK